ncbi:MAG: D-alanyl-D-alanine carboxypeptidase [Patescibacteria group bacterium]|nr:D-alanyl-D-alanine carboxypeptidase [Patescibacteria group bacterium]
MKAAWKFLLIFISFIVLVSFAVYYYYAFPNENEGIFSPLPEFLNRLKNNQVSGLKIWLPQIYAQNFDDNLIFAKSALVYDLATGKVLYEKNPKIRLPMASLTKVMAAVIGIENQKKNDEYLVSKESLVGENSMGLTEGERLRLEDLLYGLILNSGNDAAEVIAQNYSGGKKAFVKAMNDKAKALGLNDTNFTNPSGLEGDGEQYTTAYDLLVITNYAFKYPLFTKVAATFEENIQASTDHKAYYLQNETNLLSTYPGVKGVKTGFTPEAELCLITYLEHKNHKIIAVLLGSNNRRAEMKELLDYSLRSLGETPPPHP